MKQLSTVKKEDPLPDNKSDKDALDNFQLFYEALPFSPSVAVGSRLRRPSKISS